MANSHLLHSTTTVRPVVVTSSETGITYYAHAAALFILFFLWRLPTANHHHKQKSHSKGKVELRIVKSSSTRQLSSQKRKEDNGLEVLEQLHPASTKAERQRFLTANKQNATDASKQLGTYLDWRTKHEAIQATLESPVTSTGDADADAWNRAVEVALQAAGETNTRLPRLARMYLTLENTAVRDKNGSRIIHILPGQMDPQLAHPSTYAVALALYLDSRLDPCGTETCSVLLDVRGGRGWPNVHPYKQLPFIKTVTQLLLTMFPERLDTCLLYPVPPAALWIWNLVKVGIDAKTASKIHLLSGPARIHSPPPLEMEDYMSPLVAQRLEDERQATFC